MDKIVEDAQRHRANVAIEFQRALEHLTFALVHDNAPQPLTCEVEFKGWKLTASFQEAPRRAPTEVSEGTKGKGSKVDNE